MSQSAQRPMPSGSASIGSGKTAHPRSATNMLNANNVFDQSAAGLDLAMSQTLDNMRYRPMSIQGYGYGASQMPTNPRQMTYNPETLGGQFTNTQGYDAAQVRAAGGYTPDQVSAGSYDAGQLANTDLDPYLNPYTDNVIDQSLSDIDRARQMASNQTDAQATAAGAFGGSRQAVMQSENNRNYLDQSARTASQLRQSGYQNAQQAALRDIAGRDQANQFNVSNDMRAQLANQGANAQADQFGLNQAFQANMANAQADNRASEFGRQTGLQAALANMQAQNQSRQLGVDNAFRGGLANQAASNRASEFGLQQGMQAQLANQRGAENAQRLLMASGAQMGNLANLGFGMGQGVQGQMAQQGQYRRGMEQNLINAGRNQFGGFAGAPQNSMSLLAQALGSTPYGQSQSYDPGLFDYLTLGASMF